MSSVDCREEFESFSKDAEGLKTCGGRLGTKLWVVVVDVTFNKLTVTTFNGVEGTKVEDVTKSNGIELRLSPSLISSALSLTLTSVIKLELCPRTVL
jgi:hypothetical protein